MRQVATIVVAAAVLAVPQAAAKGGPPSQLLGFVGSGRDVSLVKLDALTLKPVSRAAPVGIANPSVVARVAGGGRIAVATGAAALRFLDFKTMRWEFRIAYPGIPADAVWNYADKLVTVNQSSSAEVIVVDPTRRREAFRPLGGSLAASTVADNRIVALIAPLDGIGASKLAVIDDRGRVRSVPLPQIRAGSETFGNGNGDVARFEWPALAVDRNRAVVIAGNGTTAEIRLATLAVTYRSISRSLAAVRKQANGSTRTARFVDDDVIAVSGADLSWDGTMERAAPAGLTLIDTRDWSARKLDADTVGLAPNGFGPGCIVCGGVVLGYGANGLVGYDADGKLRFRLFPGTAVQQPVIAGSYAYLGAGTHFTIVDTATGTIVKTVDTKLPTLLTQTWSY